MIKKAIYNLSDGSKKEIEYDTDWPCLSCGLPVVAASVGGTRICPWCDCGKHRNGKNWTLEETKEFGKKYKENFEK